MAPRKYDYTLDLDASFPDSHKIGRLAEIMGVPIEKAGWIILRLFCRARRHSPSGDLSHLPGLTLLEWTGTTAKQRARERLVEAEILDETKDGDKVSLFIHGFAERRYVERDEQREAGRESARDRAAKSRARHTKSAPHESRDKSARPHYPVRDSSRDSSSVILNGKQEVGTSLSPTVIVADASATKPPDPRPRDLLDRWNALAAELRLPQAEKLTPKREAAARQRIAEGLLDRWADFADSLRSAPWHLGENSGGWRADVDWLLRPGKWLALVERHAAPAPPALKSETERIIERVFAEDAPGGRP